MDMTYPTAAGTDLSARALLVSATVRVWSGEKRDRAITREICALKGAHDNSVRANKSLLGEAIRPVQAAERAVRDTVTRHTLGWTDDGTRILKGSSFLAFTAAMAAPVAAFDAAENTVGVVRYVACLADARRRAGRRRRRLRGGGRWLCRRLLRISRRRDRRRAGEQRGQMFF